MSSSSSSGEVRAFVEARTRLTPTDDACAILERAMTETCERLLRRAHKLSLHSGNDVVNARDLIAAIRYELPTGLADVVEANVGAAVRRVLDDPAASARTELRRVEPQPAAAASHMKDRYA